MPFTSKNGATLAGHSDKWSNANRSAKSHQAGQGSRGSRNQGTGQAGKAATQASQGIDTTKMSPEEKFKYFQSLGLMPSQPQAQAEPKPQPKPEPVQAEPEQAQAEQPKLSPMKTLNNTLAKMFPQSPRIIKNIFDTLKDIPSARVKLGVQIANAMLKKMEGQDLTDEEKEDMIIDAIITGAESGLL